MKIFEIGINYQTNRNWRSILKKYEDIKFNIVDSLDKDQKIILKENEAINMFLVEQNLESNELAFNTDLIFWTDDITLNTAIASNGCIISNNLLNTLMKLNLPPKFVYPLVIKEPKSKKVSMDYSLLQLITPIADWTDYSKSHYTYRRKGNKEIMKIEIGSFSSYNEYSAKRRQMRRQENIVIDISKRALTKSYDIVTQTKNYFKIREDAISKIDLRDFKGIDIVPSNDFEIILPSES